MGHYAEQVQKDIDLQTAAIKIDTALCPWCSSDMSLKRTSATHMLYRCINCKSEFIDTDKTCVYDDTYFASYTRRNASSVFSLKKKQFEKMLSVYLGEKICGRILDIGCGIGGLLAAAQSLDVQEAYGIDVSEWAIRQASSLTSNITYITGDVCDILHSKQFPEQYFDAITLTDVLEHVAQPAQLLKNSIRLLKNEGGLLLIIPNVCGASHYLMGRYWHLYQKGHTHFVSAEGLKTWCRKQGYYVCRMRGVWKTLSLGYLVDVLQYVESPLMQRLHGVLRAIIHALHMTQLVIPLPTGEQVLMLKRMS